MTGFHVSRRRPRQFLAAFVLVALAFVLGCGKPDEIRSYAVPKEAKVATEPTDRMLAAIVPAGSQAWFFKAVGPAAIVDRHAAEIQEFFTAIRAGEGERVRWELPAGWKEDAGAGVRAATIWIPAERKPLEMSVTTLPWNGTQDDVLRNVNRWRAQMQLPEIGAAGLAEATREVQAGDVKITIADLRGRFQGGPMMGPFAGGGLPGGPMPSATDQASGERPGLPAGHPPIDAAGDANSRPASETPIADAPKFEVPKSWQVVATQSGGARRATFHIDEAGRTADVTVTVFPGTEGPGIGDPLLNVNRWRREVGMAEIGKNELENAIQSIEVDGRDARYVRLIPDAGKPEQSQATDGTLAAMVTHGNRIWFIKLKGSRDLVAEQEDEFKSFLKSIRFPADGGATDGN